ncbi:MAG: hypothetical protein JWM05_3725 [Acidimicrobiales bacterium]|nr:hypothetical protein [Acidimicrobiales bacterium]
MLATVLALVTIVVVATGVIELKPVPRRAGLAVSAGRGVAGAAEAAPVRHRVLLVGDSLTYNGTPQLTDEMAAHAVDVAFVGGSGTGLLSEQDRWVRQIGEQVATFHPDVVVIEACCNYAVFEPGYVGADGLTLPPNSPAMYAAWARAARAAVRAASAGGAPVYWVVTPDAGPQVTADVRARVQRFNEISASLGVPLIDWRSTLEPAGRYTLAIDGVQVRRIDGLHFTAAGSRLVAATTWRAISAAIAAS